MIHAQLDENGLCIGCSNLKQIETYPDLVYLPNGWDEDFLWRKYVDGQWSVEKFLPPAPEPGMDVPTEIDRLKAENTKLHEQLAQTNADAISFQDFIFEKFPELA